MIFKYCNTYLTLLGFGVDKWNGCGGKVETNESEIEGAIRELFEESSLIVAEKDMLKRGYIVFNMKVSKKIMKGSTYYYIFLIIFIILLYM